MLTKSVKIRSIINADEKSLAQKIADDLIRSLSASAKTTAEIARYEDEYHYEVSFTFKLSADSFDLLEHQSFLLCTKIAVGPWLFLNLPKNENEFEFEAIFNHEAFIYHSKEYDNKLKWVHLEIN